MVVASDAWQLDWMGIRALRQSGQRGAGVRVGIVDSGVAASEQQDADNTHFAWDRIERFGVGSFAADPRDHLGHGTKVAAVIAASSFGVAPDCTIVSVAATASKHPYPKPSAAGLRLAAERGCAVVCLATAWGAANKDLQDAVHDIADRTVVVSVSDGAEPSAIRYPAVLQQTLAVTAHDSGGRPLGGVFPSWVDVAAPGVQVVTTSLSGAMIRDQGTSLAAGVVAGGLAAVLGALTEAQRVAAIPQVSRLVRELATPIASASYARTLDFPTLLAKLLEVV